jgi:hypothetical protein
VPNESSFFFRFCELKFSHSHPEVLQRSNKEFPGSKACFPKFRFRKLENGLPNPEAACRGRQPNMSGYVLGEPKRETSDSPSNLRLRFYEFEKIGIDLVCMRGRHPMRQAFVNLQRSVLQELGGQRA